MIGRKDATTGGATGRLPDVHAPAADLFALFQAKGYDAVDLAAILGAHSTSKQFGVDPSKAGQPQDSTPGVWDVKYYSDTTKPDNGTFVFPSDSALAAHPTVGKEFSGFVNNQNKWNGKFADAMARMALFGNNPSGMVDCTNALPSSTNIKRDIRSAPINARFR
jgi:L-ascorbate peroxidase